MDEFVSMPVKMRVDMHALAAGQVVLLDRAAGTARAVWNWALSRSNAYFDARSERIRRAGLEICTPEECEAAWGRVDDDDLAALTDADRKARALLAKTARKKAGVVVDAAFKSRLAEFQADTGMTLKEVHAHVMAEVDRQVTERFGRSRWQARTREDRAEVAKIELSVMSNGDILLMGSRFGGMTLGTRFTVLTREEGSPFFWWSQEKHGVNRFVVSSTLTNLDDAFKRYFTVVAPSGGSTKPRKDGRQPGWPSYKAAHHDVGFALFNIASTNPMRPVATASRILLPSIGKIRVHGKTTKLRKLIEGGAIPKSARLTRTAGEWWISVLTQAPARAVSRPTTNRQRARGAVGVDLGVALVAATSDGVTFPNPRILERHEARKQRAVAALERTTDERTLHPVTGRKVQSKGRQRARQRKARIEARTALARESFNHAITKHLATRHSLIAIEDLKVSNMTRKAKPKSDDERPGHFLPNGGAAKTGLNRAFTSVAPAQIRQQLTYKAERYGSVVVAVPAHNTSRQCAECGHISKLNRQTQSEFVCVSCGHADNADLNAAKNILARGLAISNHTAHTYS